MSLEQLANIATIVGVISIPISALFIWWQLRHQTRLAKVANTQSLVELSSPFNLALIQDSKMAEYWVTGAEKYSQYSDVEKYQYKSLLIWWLILHENIFFQKQNKMLDETIWSTWNQDLKKFARGQLANHWEDLRPYFRESFAKHIDEMIK